MLGGINTGMRDKTTTQKVSLYRICYFIIDDCPANVQKWARRRGQDPEATEAILQILTCNEYNSRVIVVDE